MTRSGCRLIVAGCAVLAFAGGLLSIAMAVRYFGPAHRYAGGLGEVGSWGTIVGAAGFGRYVGGLVRARGTVRFLAGVVTWFGTMYVPQFLAFLGSLAAEAGTPRDTCYLGLLGLLWLVFAVVLAIVAWSTDWPRSIRPVP